MIRRSLVFFIDTGADHTIVRADLVPESKLTCNFFWLSAYGNAPCRKHPLAVVKLVVSGITKTLEVVTDPSIP